MRKSLLIISLLFCCTIFSASLLAKSSGQSLDQIVAVVNDDVITKSELDHSLSIVKMQISQQNAPMPTDSVLQKQVLEQLVNKRLQLQIAKQAGVNVSDADLDKAIGTIAKQNNMSTASLYQRLSQEGMSTSDYRREIREQLTLQKLQQQEVVSHVVITPEEVTTFMRSQLWQDNGTKEYQIEDILIPLSDTPSAEEIAAARKRAVAVVAKLNQGKSFREVAQSESGAKNALQGGDLGWRKLPEIPSAFAELVSRMQAKEVAGPIQTPNGFHIIRLGGLRNLGEQQAPPDRKQIEALLMQRKFEEAIQSWVSKLRSQAFIELNLVKKNDLA
jgi:peptidyl-prolyl cis-trans isomerase SurA